MKAKLNHHAVCLGVQTSAGLFVAYYSSDGLSGLNFPSTRKTSVEDSAKTSAGIRAWHRLTAAAVKNILAGKAAGELPPLDVSCGTEFQRSVWSELRRIKPGRTQSYGEVAKSIGNKKAVRAVGGACGANPIPLIIPCHRVLAANRMIGGFSGGMDWKRKLLACEGIVLE